MLLFSINFLIIYCCTIINGYHEFGAEPRVSCEKRFCDDATVNDYPRDNITELILSNAGYIERIDEIEFEVDLGRAKAREKSLCDCNPRTMAPLVGLNVYNVPRFIVNIEQYRQKINSCSKNLTDTDFFRYTPCADITPENTDYKSMCMPKYQTVILNAVKGEQLYLDEFYVNNMYTCVLVPKSRS